MASLQRMCPLEEPDVDSPVVQHSPTSPVLSDDCSTASDSSFDNDNVSKSQMDMDMEGVRICGLMKFHNYACFIYHAEETPIPEPMVTETTCPLTINEGCFGYKIVGDNIDFTVRARYMRTDGRQDQSLHYYHTYAIRDRIDLSRFPFHFPKIPHPTNSSTLRSLALEMLPSSSDNTALSNNIAILVSRVLVENLSFFKSTFSDVVKWHIEHKHSDEMCKKSEIVSISPLTAIELFSDKNMIIIIYIDTPWSHTEG